MPYNPTPVAKSGKVPKSDMDGIEVDVGSFQTFTSEDKGVFSVDFDECAAVLLVDKKTGNGMLCHLTAQQYTLSDDNEQSGDFGEMLDELPRGDYKMFVFGRDRPMKTKSQDDAVIGHGRAKTRDIDDKRAEKKWACHGGIVYKPATQELVVYGGN
jgi:hypothetical protein